MQENLNEQKEYIQEIINKIQSKQIIGLLYNFFEVQELPEIIAIARKRTSVSGYVKISRKVFQYSIIFMIQDNKLELVIDLNLGRQGLAKTKEIKIEKSTYGIIVYTADNNQYLFSIST